MPIYEYHCRPCDQTFETLVRSPAETPECPQCGESKYLTKQFSPPAAAQSGSSARANLPISGCGAPSCCMGTGGCSLN
jgi:putative FmdB family regulatory protein